MLNREIFNFDRAGRALLAGVLVLILGLGAASVVGQTQLLGPKALLDSATSDGDGEIDISWSLQEAEEHEVFLYSHPTEVCVSYRVGSSGEFTKSCFTTEISNQDDLIVDTGIDEGTTASYEVILDTYYSDILLGGTQQKAVVSVSG